VVVAPLITLDAATTSAEAGERIDLSGTITPRKSAGLKLIVERYDDIGGQWRRVARKKVTAERGAFTTRRRFAEAGDYRLFVKFAGDTVSTASISPYVEVTVTEPFPF